MRCRRALPPLGPNAGYDIPDEQVAFAHRLIDSGAVAVIHGHSSHHVKGIEVYRQKLILYGCGDILNREGGRFGTRIRIGPDRVLKLVRA